MVDVLDMTKNIAHYKHQLDNKEKSANNPFYKYLFQARIDNTELRLLNESVDAQSHNVRSNSVIPSKKEFKIPLKQR